MMELRLHSPWCLKAYCSRKVSILHPSLLKQDKTGHRLLCKTSPWKNPYLWRHEDKKHLNKQMGPAESLQYTSDCKLLVTFYYSLTIYSFTRLGIKLHIFPYWKLLYGTKIKWICFLICFFLEKVTFGWFILSHKPEMGEKNDSYFYKRKS